MLRWEVLLHPAAYAEAIAAHPPFGATTLLLVTMAALWAVAIFSADFFQRQYRRKRPTLIWLGSLVVGVPLVALVSCALLTFLTFGIERCLGHTISFEALFCLLVIAVLPSFLMWLTAFISELSPIGLHGWHLLSIAVLVETTQRIWVMVGVANHLPWWQTLLTAAPFLIALWITGISEIWETPDSLRALSTWRRTVGKRVIVFYPPGKAPSEAREIADKADLLVAQIERNLDVKPVSFRIPIFLCEQKEDLRRLHTVKGWLADGYASAGNISLVFAPWLKMRALVAHELTHVIAGQGLKIRLMTLLDEGLAEHAKAQIFPASSRAGIRLPLPLGTLAHSHVFYEWRYVEDPDYPAADKYAHAAALADYLIGRYGMDKFKELCRQTAQDPDLDPAAQFEKAAKAVYGLSLRQLEQNWRHEWTGPGKIQFELDVPYSAEPSPPNS